MHPVFCDFGLAKSQFYQAPEQLAGQPAGGKADVFSLGCVLLELALLVAGKKRSWLAKRLGQTGFASSAIITDGEFGQHLPSDKDWWIGVKELLQRMLNKDPRQRPHAEVVARIICDLSDAAGLEVRCCHHQPKTHDPRLHASASSPASPLDSDSRGAHGSAEGARDVRVRGKDGAVLERDAADLFVAVVDFDA